MEITKTVKTSVTCPFCKEKQNVKRYPILKIDEYPKLKRKVIDLSIFQHTCMHCKQTFVDLYPMIYLETKQKMFINVALDEDMFERYIKTYFSIHELMDFMKSMNASTIRRKVSDPAELAEKITIQQSHYDDRIIEIMKFHMIQKLNENGEGIVALRFVKDGKDSKLIATREDHSKGTIPFTEMWYQAVVKSYRNILLQHSQQFEVINQDWVKHLLQPMNLVEEGEGISIQ